MAQKPQLRATLGSVAPLQPWSMLMSDAPAIIEGQAEIWDSGPSYCLRAIPLLGAVGTLFYNISSLEKTDSPSFSSHWLPIVLHLKFPLSSLACEVVLSFCRSCLGTILLIFNGYSFLDMSRGCYLAASILVLWFLHSFYPLFHIFPWPLAVGISL